MRADRWVHAKKGPWEVRSYQGRDFYFRAEGRLVTELCRGKRYAHIAPGLVFDDELYVGSYFDDWHGGPQGSLRDLVEWVAEAQDDGADRWFLK